MVNINNSTKAFVPIGALNSALGNPAIVTNVPDDATGVFFTMSFTGYYTFDGTVAAFDDGILFRNQGPFSFGTATLYLYPGCPLSFFSATGTVNYQFFWTADHKSLLTRN